MAEPKITIVTTTAWAAILPDGKPRPFILENSVRRTRHEVCQWLGGVFAHRGETPGKGWSRAYRRGWRVAQVRIEAGLIR